MPKPVCDGVAATVISVQSTHVQLVVQAGTSCLQCSKGRGCGLGLSRTANKRHTFDLSEIRIVDPSGQARSERAEELLQAGCKVSLLLPRQQVTDFILRALFIPAALLIILAAAGHHLALLAGFDADGGALIGILLVIAGGLILAHNSRYKQERNYSQRHLLQLVLATTDPRAKPMPLTRI